MFLTTTKCAEPAPGGTAAAQPLTLSGPPFPMPRGGRHRRRGDPGSPGKGTGPARAARRRGAVRGGAVGARRGAAEGTAVHGWAVPGVHREVPRGRRLRTRRGSRYLRKSPPSGARGTAGAAAAVLTAAAPRRSLTPAFNEAGPGNISPHPSPSPRVSPPSLTRIIN